MNIQVNRFGLHQSPEGVQFLHQGSPAGHNFIGWKKPSPFEVVVERKVRCPHSIFVSVGHPDAKHWETFLRLYEDPLFRAFLPVPKALGELIPYFPAPTAGWMQILVLLSKLSSPVAQTVIPYTKIGTQKLREQLEVTNIGPLVLTGIETTDQNSLNALVVEAQTRPRKLILVGARPVVIRHPMERISSTLDVEWDTMLPLPLEQLGAVALRRHCRGEQINTPFMKRDQP